MHGLSSLMFLVEFGLQNLVQLVIDDIILSQPVCTTTTSICTGQWYSNVANWIGCNMQLHCHLCGLELLAVNCFSKLRYSGRIDRDNNTIEFCILVFYCCRIK